MGMDSKEQTIIAFLNLMLCSDRLNKSNAELKGIKDQFAAILTKNPDIIDKANSRKIHSPEEIALFYEFKQKERRIRDNIEFETNTQLTWAKTLLKVTENSFMNFVIEMLNDVCMDPGLKDTREKRCLINYEEYNLIVVLKKTTEDKCKNLHDQLKSQLFLNDFGLCIRLQKRKKQEMGKKDKELLNLSCEIKGPPVKVRCSCDRDFYTFNKNQIYCSPQCKNEINLTNRKKPKSPPKKLLLEKICPECKHSYFGNARTCGKSACIKKDYRKRKKLE